MILKKIVYGLVGVWLLVSCYHEDALTPAERVMESRFEFPQGSDSWDDELQKIHDDFGIYVIYKNYNDNDFARTWEGGGGVTATYLGEALSDEQAVAAVDFVKNHIFAYLNRDVIQKVLPPYIYLAYDFCSYLDLSVYVIKLYQPVYFDGMDYWVIGWGGIEKSMGDYLPPVVYPAPSTWDECREVRARFLHVLLKEAVEKGTIAMPTGFGESFDYKTPLQYTDPYIDDPNYYLMRGFPGVISSSTYRMSSLSDIRTVNPLKCFISYVQMCVCYTKEEFESLYAEKYTLLAKTRQEVIDYVKSTYDIDLEAIAQGPKIVQ